MACHSLYFYDRKTVGETVKQQASLVTQSSLPLRNKSKLFIKHSLDQQWLRRRKISLEGEKIVSQNSQVIKALNLSKTSNSVLLFLSLMVTLHHTFHFGQSIVIAKVLCNERQLVALCVHIACDL